MSVEMGMEWSKRNGLPPTSQRDFQMLMDLIKPVAINPQSISISHEIAKGSFGMIFSAKLNGRNVAIKRIRRDDGVDLAWKLRNAYLELNIMNRLSHPNVSRFILLMLPC
eukprot:63728-Hanusia_phi.AAC.2